MSFVRARARILEISTTSGSGPFALAGAADGSYNTFASFLSVGDQTYVTVVEPGVAFWSGVATYSAANQLTLTTVEEIKGTFGAGTKEIMAGPLASTSMFREDIAGAIVTGGTSTAYTVVSHRKYNSLAELDGNIIAFTPHVTSGQGPTVAIDGLAAKPIRLVPGTALVPGVLIQGTPYLGLYNHTDGAVYLHGLSGISANPYGVPLGAGMDYWAATTPSSAFAFPAGQEISRTTYASLFALLGTTYGVGDGSTTFNLPDKTGRVSVMKEASANRLTSSFFGGSSTTLGATGGAESLTLTTAQLPALNISGTTSGSLTVSGSTSSVIQGNTSGGGGVGGGGSLGIPGSASVSGSTSGSLSVAGTVSGTGGQAHRTVQPTIVCNYIVRVL